MRYIDTGARNATHALGDWMASLKPEDIRHLRWQSGYFGSDGLAPMLPLIQRLASQGLPISCVLGSNGGETGQKDIEVLVDLIGCPRADARIGILSYTSGLFHPKVYHVTRQDGSRTAYVGSANLTLAGVTGLNVEAGVILDTHDGDPVPPLDEISASIDSWFDGTRPNVETVRSLTDIPPLVAKGVLGVPPAPRQPRHAFSGSGGGAAGIGLKPLVKFPPLPSKSTATAPGSPATPVSTKSPGTAPTAPVAPAAVALPSAPLSPFPPYILFAPGAAAPTSGTAALTGSTLPGGATGLVVRLNKDSARHFSGGTGTANISVPVASIGTVRFGVFQGKYQRPRAEFGLRMRFVSGSGSQIAQPGTTNVMVYGYAPGESGHGDVRMVVPAGPAREIRDFALGLGHLAPEVGNPMILEWPTSVDPYFKATFVEGSVPLFNTLDTMLTTAATAGQLVGQGAAWLSPGVSPIW